MAKAKKSAPSSPVESVLGIAPDKASELYLGLTDRERQVADLMATGMKNRKLAEQLGISTKTLDIHISVLRRKLGDDPADPSFIATVRGVGYRYESR